MLRKETNESVIQYYINSLIKYFKNIHAQFEDKETNELAIQYYINESTRLKKRFKKIHTQLENDDFLKTEYKLYRNGDVSLDVNSTKAASSRLIKLNKQYQQLNPDYKKLIDEIQDFNDKGNLNFNPNIVEQALVNKEQNALKSLRYSPSSQLIYEKMLNDAKQNYAANKTNWKIQKESIQLNYHDRHKNDLNKYAGCIITTPAFGAGLFFLLIYGSYHIIDKFLLISQLQSLTQEINTYLQDKEANIRQEIKRQQKLDLIAECEQRFFKCVKHKVLCGLPDTLPHTPSNKPGTK